LLIEGVSTIAEFAFALFLILAASFLIYIFGSWLSPKSAHNENEESTYACGEKAISQRLKINVSLYKYLIYFVILDSSVLLVAFASLALSAANVVFFVFYLLIMVVSSFLLVGGRDDQ
jgi:NADH:ubiquinone oxidoreductase subunit 3 (subunit A)